MSAEVKRVGWKHVGWWAALVGAAVCLAVPLGDEDAAITRSQRVVLVLLKVVIVLEPLVLLLAHVDLDVPPLAAINWLHLVGVAAGHLVAIGLALVE